MRMHSGSVLWFGVLSLLATTAAAELAGVEFSAKVLSLAPDGQTSTGRMFVGDGRMRMEMAQDGREIVRISDQNRRAEWILFPDQQTYLEHGAPSEPAAPAGGSASAADGADPCAGTPGMTCRRIGEETIAGRPAVKWEMAATHEGQTLTGTQWIDVERGMPLKQELPNGPTMELRLLGSEEIGGRAVEKWEMRVMAPDQPVSTTLQWYDPQLRLAIREEFPGGFVRELTEIRVGPQPDHLFTVPAGYTRAEPPQPAP